MLCAKRQIHDGGAARDSTTVSVPAQRAVGLSGSAPCRLCRHGHSASIPHAFAPPALRAVLASRGQSRRLSPPRGAWRPSIPPNRHAPDRPGQPPAAMRRVAVDTPELAAAGCTKASRRRRWRFLPIASMKDGSRTTRPASLWSFHATPQDWRRKVRQGRSRLSSGG